MILLTGAGGFLGSHLLERLLRKGHEVIATDSFRHNGLTDRIADAGGGWDSYQVLTHDLSVPFSPRQTNELAGVSTIINAAAGCQVDQSIRDPARFIRNNVDSVLSVLELARSLGVQRFVQVSTDEVYGDQPHRTVTDHRPSSPYAASKACQEDICHAYARTYNIPLTITNSSNMLGERQSQLAFTPQIIRKLVNNETISVHTHGGQPGARTYTYVGNVAATIVDLLDEPFFFTRVHMQGQQRLTNLELVETVAKLAGIEPDIELVESPRPGYDATYHPLDEGWEPTIPFAQGLSRTVEWFLTNRDWLV
jgi:dTDP-glucose 4,6-dehydratase